MNSSHNTTDIVITKASGEEELFKVDKLTNSLLKSGVSTAIAQHVVTEIIKWIKPGESTKRIYGHAFALLHKQCQQPALRYKLKQAIYQLGPTGYPFEILIGELFKYKQFKTEVGVVVDGYSITHEMDVIASKNKNQHLVECKYHKDQGKSVSVQVPLYVRSRVNDIIRKREKLNEFKDFNFTGWVVTNTRFSKDSITYGECNELKLIAWDYPKGEGLKELVEEFKIYPITILQSIVDEEKTELMNKGIVTCTQLLAQKSELKSLGFDDAKVDYVFDELSKLMKV